MGEVMLKFNKMYYKTEVSGDELTMSLANYKVDDSYKCDAFMYNGEEKDHMYISAYPASLNSEKNAVKIKSGVKPEVGTDMNSYISMVNNNDRNNYCIMNNGIYNYLYLLLCMITKSRFSILANRSDNTILDNGLSNSDGLFHIGDKSNKVFGIENLWGNTWTYLDGEYNLNDKLYYTIGSYAHIDTSEINLYNGVDPRIVSLNGDGYVSKVTKSDSGDLVATELQGSSSTGFSAYDNCTKCNASDKSYYKVGGFVNGISNIFNRSNFPVSTPNDDNPGSIRLVYFPS